jgi:streptogramin lyase/tRNA A-37 threonylcarbamoyl transferase component Bud32
VDQQVGTEIPGYRIESLIGRGGMGVVYLAEDLSLKRKVALKVLAPELAQDGKFRERFVRESQLAASLDHPNIIPIFEAREAGPSLYIAMRYVPGLDLKTLIAQEGPLSPQRTISILGQVASALDAAHAEGLIHRDVKPGNILITPRTESGGSDRVFLSDFGLTKRSSSDSGITATGQFVGTLDYAAPEQFEGKPLDARTDVYSLACVLYESLVGAAPFHRDQDAAVMYAHLTAARPKVTDRRPDLPKDIDRVVARAMAREPKDRYGSAGELVDAAREALEVATVAPTRTRPARRLLPRRRPRRWLIAGVAAIALLVATVGALLLRGHDGGAKGPAASSSIATVLQTYLARVGPSGKVTRIRLGAHPRAVVVAEGSVWVVNSGDDTVSRVDPVTAKSVTIRVGKGAISIAAGEGAIWVTNFAGRSVSRIDPGTNAVTSIPLDSGPIGIAVGEGAVWVAANDTIFKIDRTSRVVQSQQLPPTGDAAFIDRFSIAAGEGSVWLGRSDGTLLQFDPQSVGLRRSISLGVSPNGVSTGGGSVWVAASATPGILLQIDPRTGRRLATIRAGAGVFYAAVYPIREAVDGSHVWVTDSLNGTVSRFEAVSGQVSLPVDVGKYPTALAVGLGSVWVTVDPRPIEVS